MYSINNRPSTTMTGFLDFVEFNKDQTKFQINQQCQQILKQDSKSVGFVMIFGEKGSGQTYLSNKLVNNTVTTKNMSFNSIIRMWYDPVISNEDVNLYLLDAEGFDANQQINTIVIFIMLFLCSHVIFNQEGVLGEKTIKHFQLVSEKVFRQVQFTGLQNNNNKGNNSSSAVINNYFDENEESQNDQQVLQIYFQNTLPKLGFVLRDVHEDDLRTKMNVKFNASQFLEKFLYSDSSEQRQSEDDEIKNFIQSYFNNRELIVMSPPAQKEQDLNQKLNNLPHSELSIDFLAQVELLRSDIMMLPKPKSFQNVILNGNISLNLTRYIIGVVQKKEAFVVLDCYQFLQEAQVSFSEECGFKKYQQELQKVQKQVLDGTLNSQFILIHQMMRLRTVSIQIFNDNFRFESSTNGDLKTERAKLSDNIKELEIMFQKQTIPKILEKYNDTIIDQELEYLQTNIQNQLYQPENVLDLIEDTNSTLEVILQRMWRLDNMSSFFKNLEIVYPGILETISEIVCEKYQKQEAQYQNKLAQNQKRQIELIDRNRELTNLFDLKEQQTRAQVSVVDDYNRINFRIQEEIKKAQSQLEEDERNRNNQIEKYQSMVKSRDKEIEQLEQELELIKQGILRDQQIQKQQAERRERQEQERILQEQERQQKQRQQQEEKREKQQQQRIQRELEFQRQLELEKEIRQQQQEAVLQQRQRIRELQQKKLEEDQQQEEEQRERLLKEQEIKQQQMTDALRNSNRSQISLQNSQRNSVPYHSDEEFEDKPDNAAAPRYTEMIQQPSTENQFSFKRKPSQDDPAKNAPLNKINTPPRLFKSDIRVQKSNSEKQKVSFSVTKQQFSSEFNYESNQQRDSDKRDDLPRESLYQLMENNAQISNSEKSNKNRDTASQFSSTSGQKSILRGKSEKKKEEIVEEEIVMVQVPKTYQVEEQKNIVAKEIDFHSQRQIQSYQSEYSKQSQNQNGQAPPRDFNSYYPTNQQESDQNVASMPRHSENLQKNSIQETPQKVKSIKPLDLTPSSSEKKPVRPLQNIPQINQIYDDDQEGDPAKDLEVNKAKNPSGSDLKPSQQQKQIDEHKDDDSRHIEDQNQSQQQKIKTPRDSVEEGKEANLPEREQNPKKSNKQTDNDPEDSKEADKDDLQEINLKEKSNQSLQESQKSNLKQNTEIKDKEKEKEKEKPQQGGFFCCGGNKAQQKQDPKAQK